MRYVIIPTYQEKGNIRETASAVFALAPEYRVVVVDDASTDGTGEELDALERDFLGRFIAIRRAPPRSFARSYIEGFSYALSQADCEAVIECDADGSHPVARIPALIAALEEYEVAIGSRYVQGGDILGFQRSRLWLSSAANLYLRFMTGFRLADITAGFVAYRADLLRRIPYQDIRSNGYAFQVEMKHLATVANARMVELPIRFVDRSKGQSKMSFQTMVEAFLLGLRYWLIRAK
jgi:dolichol-phosphate mannosyltransferase